MLGPLVAYLQTPRDVNGRLLEGTLEQLAANAHAAGVDAIAVLGSVGGAAYMPRAMRKKVITTVARATNGTVPLIAGVGAMTTAEVAINLADAAAAGAHGALLQPVAYQPLLSHEVVGLYENASLTSAMPLWVYNNPATTRHRFTIDELAHIASFDNVIGFKDRAANADEVQHRIAQIGAKLTERKRAQFNWGFSGENKGATMLGAGGHTWHSALAGVMPDVCVELAQAALAGQRDEQVAAYAQKLQRALNPVTIMMAQYGGIRVAHAIAHERGLRIGALPQPLMQLPPAARGLLQLALNSVERSVEILHSGSEPEPIESLHVALTTSSPSRHSAGLTVNPYASAQRGYGQTAGSAHAIGVNDHAGTQSHATSDASASPVLDSHSALPAVGAPVRVSTRMARVPGPAITANEQTPISVEQTTASALLLTGDPELDATRVNLTRIEVPILGMGEVAPEVTPEIGHDGTNVGANDGTQPTAHDTSQEAPQHITHEPAEAPRYGTRAALQPVREHGQWDHSSAGDTPNYVPRRARTD